MCRVTGTIINGFEILEARKGDIVKAKHLDTGKIVYKHLGDIRKNKVKIK